MNQDLNNQFETIEFKIETKYKNRIKEEIKERALISLEYFVMFFIFIWLTIVAATDPYDVLRYEALQGTVIILLCLVDVGILLTAIFIPFFIRHNRGLTGTITFTIYKDDKNEIRCRCNGSKRGKSFTYDEICTKIKFQKYSIRIYYKTFKYFRVPLSQINNEQIEILKNIKFQ